MTTVKSVGADPEPEVRTGLAQILKRGIIMDVLDAEQAQTVEEAGPCVVEKVSAEKWRDPGAADLKKLKAVMGAVTVPVMAKCRIGHFAEAQILQSVGVDFIDESEVGLDPADDENYIDKTKFSVFFVCGARNLGEALHRIAEGAAMIRTTGESGTGNVVEAVRHVRQINREIGMAQAMSSAELYGYAKVLGVPIDLLQKTAQLGRLPVPFFGAGGVATPADVSLLMQLGVDGVFVGSAIFKSPDPGKQAKVFAQTVAHYKDPSVLATIIENLG